MLVSSFLKKIAAAGIIIVTLLPTVSAQQLPVKPGPYRPDTASLKQYHYPAWFRDAKFGIWSHWGPQAVPRMGDWYARGMYEEGSANYRHHLAHYGHPSKFGYKDIIPLWKAEKWEPERLMALYKKAGAKYFVSMGSHHDNFFLWNSRRHKWNAVNMGPHKDVVGIWQQAARKEGLYFGISEHLAASYTWFQASHRADTSGPNKGIPYDGANAAYADLYHTNASPGDKGWLTTNPTWMQEWYEDVKELVETYHPDLLYSDSELPFGNIGRSMLANFYNDNIAFHKGRPTAVYNCKQPSGGMWVQDLERGVQDTISPFPWQTDTSIGDWYYRTGQPYKSATDVIRMLVDIVSKNGNLLLNIVQTPEGEVEPDLLQTLDDIGNWMAINGEGIYGSRPWKVFGERPASAANIKAGNFNEGKLAYTAEDIRFTVKGNDLYAYVLDTPGDEIRIRSLGRHSQLNNKKITHIKILGSEEKIKWKEENDALVIYRPAQLPAGKVTGIRLSLK
ncbi:MAG TPA: alpha-L-fucosidase [Chitinophaga sp.]|uniref:alpha-L-fucosidase n=1 Tax=Chitinophaga sp. TaxID=1869181 RepID=UPI002C462634|nr:alpha-L-fucosidase [Chitinophaga sp.]HVI44488.1 alpha-L-fucosidase [Chitinophaga sp.]